MALQHSVIKYRAELDRLAISNQKRCTKCTLVKDHKHFTKDKRKYGGYSNQCAECAAKRTALKNNWQIETIKNRHELLLKQRELELQGLRKCDTCKLDLLISEHFQHRLNKWARFKNSCQQCAKNKSLIAKSSKSQQGVIRRTKNRTIIWAKRTLNYHKKRNKNVKISIYDLARLISDDGTAKCAYTDDLIMVGYGLSVDMKDPNGDFSIDNICLCSHVCNSTKSSMTHESFKEYLKANPNILSRIKKSNENNLKLYYLKDIPLSTIIDWIKNGKSQ